LFLFCKIQLCPSQCLVLILECVCKSHTSSPAVVDTTLIYKDTAQVPYQFLFCRVEEQFVTMFSEAIHFVGYTLLWLVIVAAWVSGTLDPVQKRLQEIVLDLMGETKVSYGLKRSLAGKKIAEEKNLRKIQEQLGDNLGGLFGKDGAAAPVGATLGKSL